MNGLLHLKLYFYNSPIKLNAFLIQHFGENITNQVWANLARHNYFYYIRSSGKIIDTNRQNVSLWQLHSLIYHELQILL